jgi:hypothetical protein
VKPTIGIGRALRLVAEEVGVPLSLFAARRRTRRLTTNRAPLTVGVTAAEQSLELPLRSLALREILRAARAGRVRIRLPLLPATFEKGPFTIEIPDGTLVVIDGVVDDPGVVNHEASRGTLEPPVRLPLGLSFRGVFIDDRGQLRCDIANFPSLNLSKRALNGLTIPHSLDETVALLFDDKPPERTEPKASPSQVGVDFEQIEVEARGVRVWPREVSLGAGTRVTPGEGTLLDVDYAPDLIEVRGHAELAAATIGGPAFKLDGIVGRGNVSVTVTADNGEPAIRVRADGVSGRVGSGQLALPDGTELRFGAIHVEDVSLDWRRFRGVSALKLAVPSLRGRLEGGVVMARVGEVLVPLFLDPVDVSGSLALDGGAIDLTFTVDGCTARAGAFELVGHGVELRVDAVEVSGRGRLRVAGGVVSFDGELTVSCALSDGRLTLDRVEARLGHTTAAVHLTTFTSEPLKLAGRGEMHGSLVELKRPMSTGAGRISATLEGVHSDGEVLRCARFECALDCSPEG